MQFGAHAFLWIGEWTVTSGNHAIDQAARTGFDFIEIPLLRPNEIDAESHAKALRDAGIECTASVVLPPDAHMPEQPERAKRFLLKALDVLEEIGGTYLCGCTGYHLGHLTGKPPTAQERSVVAETLALVAEDARRRGITLALEVCNRYETYMFNTLEDGREGILQSGSDNLELHADTYHMNIEEENFRDPLVATADVLGYIHMSESHRGRVGNGTVDWDEVFQGLKDAKYRGPLVLESFAAINPDLAAATCLWRPPADSPDVLARAGLQFLRERAAAVLQEP